jgi:hypothetical protein
VKQGKSQRVKVKYLYQLFQKKASYNLLFFSCDYVGKTGKKFGRWLSP